MNLDVSATRNWAGVYHYITNTLQFNSIPANSLKVACEQMSKTFPNMENYFLKNNILKLKDIQLFSPEAVCDNNGKKQHLLFAYF